MDVGEYETNTLVLGNLTSIGYRIYKPIASLSASYTFNASDVEDALRRDGCLVYMDAERQAFWCFYLASKDTAKNTAEQLGLDQTLEICGYALGLVEEGTFEPISLQKSRQLGTNPINTPSSSSSSGSALDRATQLLNLTNTSSSVAPEGDAKMTGTTPLDLKAHLSIPTHEVYRYFINGVVSSLVTAFCRQVGAVPLDHRNVLLPRDVDQFNTTGNTETLLTAPFGVFGFVHGVKEGDGPPADTSHGQSPDTQLSRARPELSDKFLHWKSICSRFTKSKLWESLLDGKRTPVATTNQKREPIFLEGDNLFGDIGDDMFENNELTDADFNFFDERPGHDELDLSALQDIGTAIEMTTSMNQASLALERSYVEFQEVPAMVKTAPQFAKPELRHARSILVDENRQGTPDTGSKNQMTVPGTKRHQTPFDPDTVYKKGAKSSQTARDSNDANYGVLMTRINGGVDTVPLLQETIKREDVESDSDDLSLVSDQDDSSEDLDEPSSPTKSHVFRRRLDDDVASMAASFKDLESTTAAESPSYGPNELTHLSIMEREKGEVSVTKFFSDADPAPLHISLSDDVYVAVAQILAEQACTGTLQLDAATSLLASSPVPLDTRRSLIAEARRAMESLKGTLPRSLSGAHDCPFRTLMEVQDVPWLVLPAAIPFWESLGLGPSFGTKDVCAVSIFPELEGMADHAAAFLDRMQSMYESLKLGTFGKMPTISGLANGLLGCEGTQSSMELDGMCSGSSFSGYMHMLAEVMAGAETTEKNFVVFFVYSLEKPGSAVDCCAGFQELFERYRKGLMERRKPVLNELVLQLIPLSYVALDSTLSVLSPAEYATLSFAVYDRCTMFGGPMPAPAIVLEQSLPHLIKFQPSPTPSPNLLQENSNMHLAYCQSVDERWITAAWTDNRGLRQMTASYCLGRRGRPLSRPVASVIQEMWTTTTELISLLKVQWRIIVTKCGVIDVSEVETWKEASREDRSIGASLVIMTADTNPSLQLIPPAVKLPVAASSVLYTTPAATPQPVGVVSPEQSGAPGALATGPPTPGGGDTAMNSDADADATLVDVTDTTWGAVLSHRLSNSASLTDVSPALASGYLVKRSGARPDDPPAIMEVNMIHGDQTPRAGNMRVYELGLREMLGAFRGLGTVARLRGVVDREVDVRPWHVAVAEKAARALYQLL
ncbi:hypothetical protein P8C59_008796 [Phyllachora maydis]|uniref:Mediator of RNA polymerase II transcription subunit 13 n=1 Tax=Phyllachora maydis TaxID=1825666 RepID=A0AAD9IB70_9PEZI|nr:hypothetical protein P8C59_008796 [Phyllachora maydis]